MKPWPILLVLLAGCVHHHRPGVLGAPLPNQPVSAPTWSSIRAAANGAYVCAENAGESDLVANRTEVGTWELFQVLQNADGTVSLLSAITGRYVSADLNNDGRLIANRTAIDAWEKFRLVRQANGTVALLAIANNAYVSADLNSGAVLIANRPVASTWEQFTIR